MITVRLILPVSLPGLTGQSSIPRSVVAGSPGQSPRSSRGRAVTGQTQVDLIEKCSNRCVGDARSHNLSGSAPAHTCESSGRRGIRLLAGPSGECLADNALSERAKSSAARRHLRIQAYSQNEKILDNRLIIGRIALNLTRHGPIDDGAFAEPIDLATRYYIASPSRPVSPMNDCLQKTNRRPIKYADAKS
jgi:hypothetical protein